VCLSGRGDSEDAAVGRAGGGGDFAGKTPSTSTSLAAGGGGPGLLLLVRVLESVVDGASLIEHASCASRLFQPKGTQPGARRWMRCAGCTVQLQEKQCGRR
jgi:hypothetical protein